MDNITVLADHASIPVETARYMVWHELPSHFVTVGIDVNFEKIGLEQWMVRVDAGRKLDKDVVAGFFHDEIGLTTLLSPLISKSFTMLVAIPRDQHFKLERILQYLAASEIVNEYAMKKIRWARHVSLEPSHYDFQQRKWSFDWKNMELQSMLKKSDPAFNIDSTKGQTSRIDQKDLQILRALQRRVPRSISKLAGVVGSDQHGLRYHYNEHVKPLIRGYYLRMLPPDSSDGQNSLFFRYEPSNDEDLEEARRIALSLPFTTTEWKTDTEYAWLTQWPSDFANQALKYLDRRIARLSGRLEHFLIDSESALTQAIPCDFFDEETRSWKYDPKKGMGLFVTPPLKQCN